MGDFLGSSPSTTSSWSPGTSLSAEGNWKSLEGEVAVNLNCSIFPSPFTPFENLDYMGNAERFDFNGRYLDSGIFTSPFTPFESLDHIRNTERFDFDFNGRSMDMDEFDLYQAHLRASPVHGSRLAQLFPGASSTANQDSRRKKKTKSAKNTVCVFCKNNSEPLSVYGSHLLKDGAGKVTCPILRRYTCPICGAVGDNAHTIKYCPLNTNVDCGLSLLRSTRGKTNHQAPLKS